MGRFKVCPTPADQQKTVLKSWMALKQRMTNESKRMCSQYNSFSKTCPTVDHEYER